jgi:hypothetical protein
MALPSGKLGGQRTYANIAIEAALTIRMVCHLPWAGVPRAPWPQSRPNGSLTLALTTSMLAISAEGR